MKLDKLNIGIIGATGAVGAQALKLLSKRKLLCINDSKATNFESTLQSLKSYKTQFFSYGQLGQLQGLQR